MKKLSKILSLLLVVLMMFSTISITAAAADTYTVKYHKNGGRGTMTNSTHTFSAYSHMAVSMAYSIPTYSSMLLCL